MEPRQGNRGEIHWGYITRMPSFIFPLCFCWYFFWICINQTDSYFFYWLSDGWHLRAWSTSVQAHILTGLPWCCFQTLSYQRNVWLWMWMMKKKIETVTVRSQRISLLGNLIYFCKWNFDYQLLVNKTFICSLVIIEWGQTPVTFNSARAMSVHRHSNFGWFLQNVT